MSESPRLQPNAPQSQRIADHGHRAERHRRARDDRTERRLRDGYRMPAGIGTPATL